MVQEENKEMAGYSGGRKEDLTACPWGLGTGVSQGAPAQVSASLLGGSVQPLFQRCLKADRGVGPSPGGQNANRTRRRGGCTFLQLRTDFQGSGKVPDSPAKGGQASHLLLDYHQAPPEATTGKDSFPPGN